MKPTLNQLAERYKNDKGSWHHDYCRHYDKHFTPFRDKQIVVLELGVGGYEYPDKGGSGLRMWSDYFERGKIIGVDLFDKSKVFLNERTTVYQCSQVDEEGLNDIISHEGTPTIIIDDASHINSLTIRSFEILFPKLASGGIYVIEDLESSWWKDHGFDGEPNYRDFSAKTSINLLRDLINSVNAKHLPKDESFLPIESIHFYQNMAIIHKK